LQYYISQYSLRGLNFWWLGGTPIFGFHVI
jgi:hypothetical protein